MGHHRVVLEPLNYFGPAMLTGESRAWLATLRGARSMALGEGWMLEVVKAPIAKAPAPVLKALRERGMGYCVLPASAPLEAQMTPVQRVARVSGVLKSRYGHQPDQVAVTVSGRELGVMFWESNDDEEARERLSTTVSTVGLSTQSMPVTGRRYEIILAFDGALDAKQRRRTAEDLAALVATLFDKGEPLVPNEVLFAAPLYPFTRMRGFLVSAEDNPSGSSRPRPATWLQLLPVFEDEARSLRSAPDSSRYERLAATVGTGLGKPRRKPQRFV